MKNVQRTIPVMFEKVDQIDTRFQKVKIWLMHLGQNYNNSIFTREAVENALDTLKNTPILGFVEESRLGEKDFRGHEVELVVEGGEVKAKYIGQAFGVIPENCNPRFEVKKGDFDNDLEYLVVDGLMWTKLEDGVDILNAHGEVAQSMELHEDYDGYWNEDGVFVFTRFSFYGACLLGQDVLPAMQKASVEVSFSESINVYQKEIAKKLEEFRLTFSKQDKEVEQTMTLEELLAKYSTTVEDLAEKGIDVSKYTIEELEVKLEEVFTEDQSGDGGESDPQVDDGNDDDVSDEDGSDEGEEDEEEGQDFSKKGKEYGGAVSQSGKFSLQFELSHDDIRRKLYSGLDEHIATATGKEYSWNYIVAVYDNYFISEDDYGENFYKVEYTKNGDNITLGEVKEVFPMFLTAEEKGALEMMRSNFEQYEKENKELKDFQANVLKERHEALAEEIFSKFNKLTADDISDLRENVHDYTLEELESKLFERLGRKTANFTLPKPSQSYSIKLNINQGKDSDTSGYAHLLKKHGLT